jgi:hypothetical protein
LGDVQEPKPFIVTVIPRDPTPETGVADVIVGALGIAGALLLLALVLGGLFAALRLFWLRRHPPADDHLPPVSPFVQDAAAPPSSQAR